MFFDTTVYFAFLAFIVVMYWRLPHRQQNVLLLLASYFFYGWWDWRFLGLIAISTLVDFFAANYIAQSSDVLRRRVLLTLSLVLNFGFLGIFKYFNFFADSLSAALIGLGLPGYTGTVLHVILPPGISFYTFQAVAYIVDVYHRKLEPSRSLVDYALFISLFPHLVAGPIQRPSHLLPQVQKPRHLDSESFFDGISLIIIGLFRKCVIADNCALLADAAFSGRFGVPDLGTVLVGTYAFAWQIYSDFSGYSDIARGSAQLLGFHFMVNFRQPYLAVNLQDFWHRWHISLSTWLRDYLYIPLGGSRQSSAKTYRNLMATMLLGGLWHGANWTYVVWGGIHGIGLAMERWFQGGSKSVAEPEPGRAMKWVSRIVTFHVVCLAWILFRAQSIGEAMHFLSGIGTFHFGPAFSPAILSLATFAIPMFLLDLVMEKSNEEYPFQHSMVTRKIAIGAALAVGLMLFSANSSAAFIYFRF